MPLQITPTTLPSPGRAKNATESIILPGVNIQGGSFSTLAPGANTIYYFPIHLIAPRTFTGLLCEVTTAAASGKARMSLYNDDGDLTPGALVVDGGEVDCSATGVKESTLSVPLAAGRYLLGWNCNNGSIQVRFARGYSEALAILPTIGGNAFRSELTVSSAYGAFASTGVAWTSTGGFSQPPPWFLFCRVAS